jgi:hypothetical protein
MFFARAGIFLSALLVVLVLAAVAVLGVSLSAVSLQPAQPSPAEIVTSRFPSPDDALAIRPVTTFSTASVMPIEHWETSDQGALSGIAMAAPPWPTAAETPAATETPGVPISEPRGEEQKGESAAIVETAKLTPPKIQGANTPPGRGTSRSNNVLNDAQIASIKRRLNLTAEQEKLWPAIEAALRKIVYTKTAMSPQTRAAQSGGSPAAYIDPSSAEVRQLKDAALPLIKRLNDEQKREVKMLAYVMGLEAVASQF